MLICTFTFVVNYKNERLTIQNNTYEFVCLITQKRLIWKYLLNILFLKLIQLQTLEIDYGIKQDKNIYGHADSNWKKLHYRLNGRARAGSIHYQWLPFSVEIQKNFTDNKNLKISYLGDIKIY